MTTLSEIYGGPIETESGLGSLTLPGFLQEIAEKHADREAVCWHNLAGERQSWSYSEFFAESRKIAKSLLAAGVGRNTRVGILITNRPDWLFAMLGVPWLAALRLP